MSLIEKADRRRRLAVAADAYTQAVKQRVAADQYLEACQADERRAQGAYYGALAACYADELATAREAQREVKCSRKC